MPPRGREGIALQGVKRTSTHHPVERRGTPRRQALPEPVILERGSREAELEQGEHATGLQAGSHLRPRLLASEPGEEQGRHATATREDRGGVWRTESLAQRCHLERADPPEHQGHLGHGTELLHRNRHEAPLLQVGREVAS
jgi:hypothetical protein